MFGELNLDGVANSRTSGFGPCLMKIRSLKLPRSISGQLISLNSAKLPSVLPFSQLQTSSSTLLQSFPELAPKLLTPPRLDPDSSSKVFAVDKPQKIPAAVSINAVYGGSVKTTSVVPSYLNPRTCTNTSYPHICKYRRKMMESGT